MSEPQKFNGEIEWQKLPACGYIRGKLQDGSEYVISKNPNMTPFLSRVYDAKHRFESKFGHPPPMLWLGPKAMEEFEAMRKELEASVNFIRDPSQASERYTLAGMKVYLQTDQEGICCAKSMYS